MVFKNTTTTNNDSLFINIAVASKYPLKIFRKFFIFNYTNLKKKTYLSTQLLPQNTLSNAIGHSSQEIFTLKVERLKGLVPLWPQCASEGGFRKHPSSPGVRTCTCPEQGGHRLQTRQLQERKTASCHSVCIPVVLSTTGSREDGLKDLQRSHTAFRMIT